MQKNKTITLEAFGGAGTATGANFLIKKDNFSFLVDCGLLQGSDFANTENSSPFGYEPSTIGHLLITHAHMDHIGRIPKLVREGFNGVIHSTKETFELAGIMLPDALNILTREARENGREPLYEEMDMNKALNLWTVHPYHEEFDIGEIKVNFKDAGHILGSAIIETIIEGKKIVFTGDLGNSPSPLLRDVEKVEGADYMVIESVYGDRNHDDKSLRDDKFYKVLKDTISRGGTVVIPAFSIERTQVILYAINELMEGGKLSPVPVFLDSPLAIKATSIYRSSHNLFNEKTREDISSGDDIFNWKTLKIIKDFNESGMIHRTNGPKIIIAGSGMSAGGRVISHEKHYLKDPNSTIVFVGYQSVGSLGRRIEEGAKKVLIEGEEVKVRARVETVSGYSSHMDSNHLVEFVSHSSKTLKKVFVAMGEPKSSTFLSQRISDEFSLEAVAIEKGVLYELE